jgi:hypothetical protein
MVSACVLVVLCGAFLCCAQQSFLAIAAARSNTVISRGASRLPRLTIIDEASPPARCSPHQLVNFKWLMTASKSVLNDLTTTKQI